jgi:hypothetical protein
MLASTSAGNGSPSIVIVPCKCAVFFAPPPVSHPANPPKTITIPAISVFRRSRIMRVVDM